MVNAALPIFRYHPDPLKTGVVVASDKPCACCERPRGYIYRGPVYSREELCEALCPWCVADGSAAKRFEAHFTGGRLHAASVPRPIIDHVLYRTPGYFCWQSQNWQAHCGDACAYHGDATVEDVANASRSTIDAWKTENNMTDADWLGFADGYQPMGHSAFYKFVCLHCGEVRLSWDLD